MPFNPLDDYNNGVVQYFHAKKGGYGSEVRVTKSAKQGRNVGISGRLNASDGYSGRGFKVGWGKNIRYTRKPTKTGGAPSSINMSLVAKYIEFGFSGKIFGGKKVEVPERPFFRTANANYHRDVYIPTVKKFIALNTRRRVGAMRGQEHLTNGQLNVLGKALRDGVSSEILNNGRSYKKNTKQTKAWKKNKGTPPLLDTGRLGAKVIYTVQLGKIR